MLLSKVSGSCLFAAAALIAFAPAAAAQPQPTEPTEAEAPEETFTYQTGSHILVIGAIKDPASAEIPAPAEDVTVPELPVVYEDDADAAEVTAPAAAVLPVSPAR